MIPFTFVSPANLPNKSSVKSSGKCIWELHLDAIRIKLRTVEFEKLIPYLGERR